MQAMVPVVSVAEGTANFIPDDKLAAVTIARKLGKAGGSAQVKVAIHRGFSLKEAIEYYAGIDRYVIIATPEQSIFSRSLLFMGRIVRPDLSITSGDDHSEESIVLDCEHVCEELRNIVIEGRYVGATPKSVGKPVQIPVDAVFNYRGLPNCSPLVSDGSHAGKSIERPLFSSGIDGTDPKAEFWTYGGIFLYLIGWRCSDDNRRYPFIDFSAFVRTCMACYNARPKGRDVQYFLAQRAPEMNFANLNILDALEKLCQAAGIEYAYRSAYINGRPAFVFDGWAAGMGREMTLQLQDRSDDVVTHGWPDEDAEEVLEKNNINQVRVTYDASQVITAVKVTGAPKRVEFTAELVPGWPKDGVLDDVDDAADAKKRAAKHWVLDEEDIKNDGWYQQFSAGSGRGEALKYGRYWVLNEDGAFDDRIVFDVAKTLADDASRTAKRPRQLLPCLSRDGQGKSLGIYVEVSFDGGNTWVPQSGVRNLNDRCGIELSAGDLSQMMPPGVEDPSVANAWYALLDGKFQVRVTACVELDTCLEVEEKVSAGTERWQNVRDANLRYWKKKGSLAPNDNVEEYDNTDAASEMARAILNRSSQFQMPSEQTIPWFETDYVVGDRIVQIDGRDIPLKMSLGEVESSPIVVGLTWHFGQSYCTKLILQDDRLSSDVV